MIFTVTLLYYYDYDYYFIIVIIIIIIIIIIIMRSSVDSAPAKHAEGCEFETHAECVRGFLGINSSRVPTTPTQSLK